MSIKKIYLLLTIIITLTFIFIGYIILNNPSHNISIKSYYRQFFPVTHQPQLSPSPQPNISPLPLTSNQTEYQLNLTSDLNQNLTTQVTLDPLRPQPNQVLTITIKPNHSTPINLFQVILTTDNASTTQDLKFLSNNTWQASWKVKDTTNLHYSLYIGLEDQLGNIYQGQLDLIK